MTATIAAAQYPITEHANFASWQAHTERWVAEAAAENADLLLFPEYGSMELVSIFDDAIRRDIRRQVLEMNELKDKFCRTFENLARKYNVLIVAPSIPIIEYNVHVNRAYVFGPEGLAGYQDKFFMTRFEDEHWGIQSAPKRLTVFETSWGSFGVQICYDCEFALGSQHLCAAGATLILAPSCTETIRGATRVHVGARARALENQAFTVVAQTVGEALWSPAVDVNFGYAAFYSSPDKNLPEEGIIAKMPAQKVGWLVRELDFSKIDDVRSDGHVFNYKDHRSVQSSISGQPIEVVRVLL